MKFLTQNSYLDLHHWQGVWHFPNKYHRYLIYKCSLYYGQQFKWVVSFLMKLINLIDNAKSKTFKLIDVLFASRHSQSLDQGDRGVNLFYLVNVYLAIWRLLKICSQTCNKREEHNNIPFHRIFNLIPLDPELDMLTIMLCHFPLHFRVKVKHQQ